MKKVRIIVSFVLLVSLFSSNVYAVSEAPTPVEQQSLSDAKLNEVTAEEKLEADALGLIITEKITDPTVIQDLVLAGQADYGPDGQLPVEIIIYETKETYYEEPENTILRAKEIGVTKANSKIVRFEDEYDEYEIPGPSIDRVEYTRTDTVGWEYKTQGSLEVSGTVYTVAQIKAAVSASTGHTIGRSETKTLEYSIDIPENETWVIRVWTNFRQYDWTAKVGNVTLATGKTWYPAGLKIEKQVYNG